MQLIIVKKEFDGRRSFRSTLKSIHGASEEWLIIEIHIHTKNIAWVLIATLFGCNFCAVTLYPSIAKLEIDNMMIWRHTWNTIRLQHVCKIAQKFRINSNLFSTKRRTMDELYEYGKASEWQYRFASVAPIHVYTI